MPRCCEPIPAEFKPCYASVLACGPDPIALAYEVRALERQRITSCFTAWCNRCSCTYMLATDLDKFPCPSAHHVHKLRLLAALQEAGVYVHQPETSRQPERAGGTASR